MHRRRMPDRDRDAQIHFEAKTQMCWNNTQMCKIQLGQAPLSKTKCISVLLKAHMASKKRKNGDAGSSKAAAAAEAPRPTKIYAAPVPVDIGAAGTEVILLKIPVRDA